MKIWISSYNLLLSWILLFLISCSTHKRAGVMDKEKPLPAREESSMAETPGYKGIWFTLGQYQSSYGDKYSGGLGTYTANHRPLAIYAKEADKTFFVYGGTIEGKKHLLAMASYYDHKTGKVPQPVIVHDKKGVNDPHDNPSLCIDDQGYLWVFVSGRGRARPGFKYRSAQPYSTKQFDLVATQEFTYPQPLFVKGRGFFHLYTRYTKGRELYWETSPDGMKWSDENKLAGFGGHYQVATEKKGIIASAFNWHPGGDVDKRTNLYYIQTDDWGKTWKNAQGKILKTPLNDSQNDALVHDYQSEGKLVYINDIQFDSKGHPVIFYIVSTSSKPGPEYGPRIWTIARFSGEKWEFHEITTSDHNYDMGSLSIEEDGTLRVIGPSDPGPGPYGTGGEVVIWESGDEGKTWTRARQVTQKSPRNHSYVRIPLNPHPDFYAFWADGDPFAFSESHLYFMNKEGRAFELPYRMKRDFEKPKRLK